MFMLKTSNLFDTVNFSSSDFDPSKPLQIRLGFFFGFLEGFFWYLSSDQPNKLQKGFLLHSEFF